MHASINKVFNLIKKTGDRCIVLSPDSDDAYVVMSFAEYERQTMVQADVSDLSEDELLDKINRDIAVWKSLQEDTQHADILDDLSQSNKKPDFEPYSDNLADTSQNFDEYSDSEDEFSDNDYQEEPYYFEKV